LSGAAGIIRIGTVQQCFRFFQRVAQAVLHLLLHQLIQREEAARQYDANRQERK
jgi:hypothetical protein